MCPHPKASQAAAVSLPRKSARPADVHAARVVTVSGAAQHAVGSGQCPARYASAAWRVVLMAHGRARPLVDANKERTCASEQGPFPPRRPHHFWKRASSFVKPSEEMGDPVVSNIPVERAAVAITVPARGGEHSGDPDAEKKWIIADGFTPSVSADMMRKASANELLRLFGKLVTDRVALNRSLDESFEVSVTLADPEAYKSAVEAIQKHMVTLSETTKALEEKLRATKHEPAAKAVQAANRLEADRFAAVLQQQIAKQRLVAAQFEDDGQHKKDVSAKEADVHNITRELNEAIAEVRSELQDVE